MLTLCVSDPSVPLLKAYQPDASLPEFPRDRNILFFDLSPEAATDPIYTEITRTDSAETHTRILPLSLKIICYGPKAESLCYAVIQRLFTDGPLALLRKARVYPVKDPPEPRLLYEPEGGLWRIRCDGSVSLRTVIPETLTYEPLAGPPSLVLHSET